MKKFLPLLLALLLCLTAISCDKKNTAPPSSDPPEENPQSSGDPDPIESEPQSDAPAVILSDADKVRLRALIDDYNGRRYPAWSIGRPTGIIFFYSSDERVRMPDEYLPEGQTYDFYITSEVTAVALGPTDETPAVTVAVSHDKAQTWVDAQLPVEEAGKLPRGPDGNDYFCQIAFRDDDNGLLVLFNEESAVAYITEDGGSEWTFAGTFSPPGVFYDLCSANGQYFIIGNNNGCPIASKSADGVRWEERVLPPDRDYDKLVCDYIAFAGNIGFANADRGTTYATVDYGETWVFAKDLL